MTIVMTQIYILIKSYKGNMTIVMTPNIQFKEL